MSSFEVCSVYEDFGPTLECVSDHLEAQLKAQRDELFGDYESWLMLVIGAMIFFMQAGFAMVCAGGVRKVCSLLKRRRRQTLKYLTSCNWPSHTSVLNRKT